MSNNIGPVWVPEVLAGRAAAHAKHGANSIEATPADSSRWLPILVEEVGEVAAEQTYDKGEPGALRAELIDLVCVATVWIDAIDAANVVPVEG